MNISNIDEDLIDIISILDQAGFKPFASCDGVQVHHPNDKRIEDAYLSFLESSKILDLMAAFKRDPDSFKITMNDCTKDKPYELYGNEISGNIYAIYFENQNGERTEYLEKIVKRNN